MAIGANWGRVVCAAGYDLRLYDLHAYDDTIERWLADREGE